MQAWLSGCCFQKVWQVILEKKTSKNDNKKLYNKHFYRRQMWFLHRELKAEGIVNSVGIKKKEIEWETQSINSCPNKYIHTSKGNYNGEQLRVLLVRIDGDWLLFIRFSAPLHCILLGPYPTRSHHYFQGASCWNWVWKITFFCNTM